MTALRPIPHQFVNLQAYPEAHDCPGCDNQPAPCPTYAGTDPFYLQLRNDPQPVTACLRADAGGALEFDDPCGTFLLNSDLTEAGGEWTLTDRWTWSTPAVGFYNAAPYPNGAAILGPNPWLALGPGVYRFSFNLHALTQGGVQLRVGSLASPTYTAPGTYDWVVYIDAFNLINTFRFVAQNGFDGDIISLRVGRAATAWDGLANGWEMTPDGGGWQHVPGYSGALTFTLPVGLAAYKIVCRVDGSSDPQAYLDLYHGATLLRRIYGNGTFAYYHDLPTWDVLRWVPSLAWDGALYLEQLAVSPRGHVFGLLQGSGHLADLGPGYYEGDFVTLGPLRFDDLRDFNGDPLPYGCYDVGVWDATDAAALGELVTGGDMTTPSAWSVSTSPGGGTYDWATDPDVPLPYRGEQWQGFLFRGRLSQPLPDLTTDTCYVVTVRVLPAFDSSGVAQPFNGAFLVKIGGAAVALPESPTGPYLYSYVVDPVAALGPLELEFVDATFAVADVSVHRCAGATLVTDATFRSSCLAFGGEADCDSAYVEGTDPGTYEVPSLIVGQSDWLSPVAYGFQWNRYFRLGQRCPTYLLNPRADGADDRYAYRDGYNCRTAGEVETVWDLVLGRQGYVSHEALATLVKCPQVRLVRGGPPLTTPGDLYLITSDDYQPNWPKNARAHAADVALEVVRLESSRRYLRARF